MVLCNPAGHMHSASNWYGGRKVTRKGDGGGLTRPLQSAAWRFTGDAKYLVPIEARIASSGAKELGELNENAFDVLPGGARLAASLSPQDTGKGGDLGQYVTWQASGDTAWLTALHAQAFADKTNHEYPYTDGQW